MRDTLHQFNCTKFFFSLINQFRSRTHENEINLKKKQVVGIEAECSNNEDEHDDAWESLKDSENEECNVRDEFPTTTQSCFSAASP